MGMKMKGGGREKLKLVTREEWEPKTSLGLMVKEGEITSVEQIFDLGKRILEPEIVDVLIPDLESETLQIKSTQRSTDSGRKASFRIVVIVGDLKGHVGIGVGKSDEIRPAIQYAIKNAKKNIVSITSGCGSWECKCNIEHSVPQRTIGKEGSTKVTLKPAPRGLGLAGNEVVKKVLSMAGIKDVWSFSSGGGNVYNMASATINALDNLNKLKPLS